MRNHIITAGDSRAVTLLLSCSLPPFPQQHGNPRRQTQQDTRDLGEGDTRPWEQWHGACQVPLQPSCQGHWTQNPGGKWMWFSSKIFIGSFWGAFLIPHSMREHWNSGFVLLLLCVQHGSVTVLEPGFLC